MTSRHTGSYGFVYKYDITWVNAISCAWIGVGNLWMFAGLLILMKKADRNLSNKIAVLEK